MTIKLSVGTGRALRMEDCSTSLADRPEIPQREDCSTSLANRPEIPQREDCSTSLADRPEIPQREEMERNDFVFEIFELAARYEFCVNSTLMSIKIGDLASKEIAYSKELAEICIYLSGEFYEEEVFEEILEEWKMENFFPSLMKVFALTGYNLYQCMTLADAMTVITNLPVDPQVALWLAFSPGYLSLGPRAWLLTLPRLLKRCSTLS